MRLRTIPTRFRAYRRGPVFDAQAGDLAEVFDIAADERRVVCQGDAGDEQVAAANLSEFLVLAELVEFLRSRGIDN